MKKMLIPVLLVSFLLSVSFSLLPLSSSLASDLAGQYFKDGISFYDQENYDQALANFQKAIQEDQNYAEAYYNLGIVYDLQGRFHEAIKAYEKVTQIDPRVGTVLENLAQDCYAVGNLKESMDYIKLAESMGRPVDKAFYNRMWTEYKNMKGKRMAEEKRIKAASSEAYTARELEQVNKNLESAIISLEKEIKQQAGNSKAGNSENSKAGNFHAEDFGDMIDLGIRYRQKGEIDKSIDIFTRAINLNAGNPALNARKMMIYAELGLCYYFKDRQDLFVQNFGEAKKIGFNPSKSLNDLYLQCAAKK